MPAIVLSIDELVSKRRRCSVRASEAAERPLTYVYLGKGVEDAKDIEQPQDHADDDNAIEDGFDVVLHGDEAIHKPEEEAHNDERDDEMH
jgi:hypothetical protein